MQAGQHVGAARGGGDRDGEAVTLASYLDALELEHIERRDSSLGRRARVASRATAHGSATGPRCASLSGLSTNRIAWICPPSTSIVKVLMTLPSRSWTIAPGWPLIWQGCMVASIAVSRGKMEASTRATLSAPVTLLARGGGLPPL